MGQVSSCTPDRCSASDTMRCIVSDRCCTHPVPDRATNTVKVDITRLASDDAVGKENTLPWSFVSNAASPEDAARHPCPMPIKATLPAHVAAKFVADYCAEHQDEKEIHLKPADGITAYAQTRVQAKDARLPSLEAENCRSWQDGWLGAFRTTIAGTQFDGHALQGLRVLSGALSEPFDDDEAYDDFIPADIPADKHPEEGTRNPIAEPFVTYDEVDTPDTEEASRAHEGVKLNSQITSLKAVASTCTQTHSDDLEGKFRQSRVSWATINEHVITSMSTSEATTDCSSLISPISRGSGSQMSSPARSRSSRLSLRGSSANVPSPAASWSTSQSEAQAHSPSEDRMLEAQSLVANMLQLSSEAAPARQAGQRGRSRRRKSAPPATQLGETTSAKGNRRNMSCGSKETSLQPINGRMPQFPAAEKLTPANSKSRWAKRP